LFKHQSLGVKGIGDDTAWPIPTDLSTQTDIFLGGDISLGHTRLQLWGIFFCAEAINLILPENDIHGYVNESKDCPP
jgi:hypothetical protein